MIKFKVKSSILVIWFVLFACGANNVETEENAKTWAERLGYPAGKKVIILHADDSGLCAEANAAMIAYMEKGQIQSSSVMMPCPYADSIMAWYEAHPAKDIGLHLTLTSEWKTYRWPPLAGVDNVPTLVDPEGFMWRDVRSVVQHADAKEVETELRAQIDHALALGVRPGHMDTHMGTVYGSLEFTKIYLELAMEYNIPAMVIEFTEPIVQKFKSQGYPITDELVSYISDYTLPKLDDFWSVPDGNSYDDKKSKFMHLVQSLPPGLHEIIFHPSIETDKLKSITNSWQQRVWEAQMFSDPQVLEFLENENIVFTNWKEMMQRFQ
ncbi:polysaccharide deacetylase family protein [candidate division KSB1 bacterium]|nr:polysaccharide deacetylase family protein [candidate division KSB1 bacterium]